MNTYFRLLKYAKPYKWLIPQYFIYTLLFVLFSVVNLAVLAPLLNLLFKPKQTVIETTTVEHDTLSLDKFYAFLNEFISTQTKEDALYTICLILIISVILANLFNYLTLMLQAKARINFTMMRMRSYATPILNYCVIILQCEAENFNN